MFAFLQDLDNDIRDGLLIQLRNLWTHTSTAIEGNTLTLKETAVVLEKGTTISGKPLKDHEEVVGHAKAIDLVYDFIRSGADLTEKNLFDLHKAVQTERIIDVYKPVGAWKVEPNSTVIVSGNDQIIFEYASPKDVPELMQGWLALFQKILQEKTPNEEKALSAYVFLHISFVGIHPFWDGNGRLARLIANAPVIRAGYPPIIIPKERRQEYIEALSEYHVAVETVTARDELLTHVDKLDRFKRFCAESWSESTKLVDEAHKKQKERNQQKNKGIK
ncbi:MAG: cell filamentation protein Fic [Desulfobacteraceae bacterium 4484_190.2]|nr:MAG: cell filamentation protein Fic [Desulfobacteraceae bacterium 4484_190.2]